MWGVESGGSKSILQCVPQVHSAEPYSDIGLKSNDNLETRCFEEEELVDV